jgi:hypothetical protein
VTPLLRVGSRRTWRAFGATGHPMRHARLCDDARACPTPRARGACGRGVGPSTAVTRRVSGRVARRLSYFRRRRPQQAVPAPSQIEHRALPAARPPPPSSRGVHDSAGVPATCAPPLPGSPQSHSAPPPRTRGHRPYNLQGARPARAPGREFQRRRPPHPGEARQMGAGRINTPGAGRRRPRGRPAGARRARKQAPRRPRCGAAGLNSNQRVHPSVKGSPRAKAGRVPWAACMATRRRRGWSAAAPARSAAELAAKVVLANAGPRGRRRGALGEHKRDDEDLGGRACDEEGGLYEFVPCCSVGRRAHAHARTRA